MHMRQTPLELGIRRGTVVPPSDGWEAHSWYLVEVAFTAGNPIHRSLFFTGFLNGKYKTPGGYNQLVPLNTPGGENSEIHHTFYIKAIRKLFSSEELENEVAK